MLVEKNHLIYFGGDAGFRSIRHCASNSEVRFDITQCPYCKYLIEIGCPEIIQVSCNIDEYIYGNLPGLDFKRTEPVYMEIPIIMACLIVGILPAVAMVVGIVELISEGIAKLDRILQ